MSTAFDYTEAQIRNALIKTSVGWAGGFAHRLHYGFVSRGHKQHVPTLPGCNPPPKKLCGDSCSGPGQT